MTSKKGMFCRFGIAGLQSSARVAIVGGGHREPNQGWGRKVHLPVAARVVVEHQVAFKAGVRRGGWGILVVQSSLRMRCCFREVALHAFPVFAVGCWSGGVIRGILVLAVWSLSLSVVFFLVEAVGKRKSSQRFACLPCLRGPRSAGTPWLPV